MDYKEKIKKLLKLAESPNEHEAKAALCKARQIMAEHKLREEDFIEPEKAKVIKRLVGIYCTKRKGAWIPALASVVAGNYCCASWRQHEYHAQKSEVGFIGLEEDFEICSVVFKYAYDSVQSQIQEIRNAYKDWYSTSYITKLCESYGFGFVIGVCEAFKKQTEEHSEEWGLVMHLPQAVTDAASDMRYEIYKEPEEQITRKEYEYRKKGYQDGVHFEPSARLQEEQ